MTTTFTRPRLTRSQFFFLQCRDRLTPAERHILSTATVVDDAPAPADENAASLATMAGFLGAIGGAK